MATCGLSLCFVVVWLKWFVTQSLVEIHERARKGENTVERGKEELIAYMHWRSGEKVLKAYNHFFQPAGHATVQDSIFKKLRVSETKKVQTIQQSKRKVAEPRQIPVQPQKQQQEATALYAFLIGTGGSTDDLIETC